MLTGALFPGQGYPVLLARVFAMPGLAIRPGTVTPSAPPGTGLRSPRSTEPRSSCHRPMSSRTSSGCPAQRLRHIGDPKILTPRQPEALSALTRRLPQRERAAAVDGLLATCRVKAVKHADIDQVAWFLGQLGEAAPTGQLAQTVHESLHDCPVRC